MNQAKIYVGNLPYESSEQDLEQLFSQYGEIKEVKVITNRETGQSKGFGFITFEKQEFAEESLKANGTEVQGRKIRVNMANDDTRRSGSRGRDSRGFRGRRSGGHF